MRSVRAMLASWARGVLPVVLGLAIAVATGCGGASSSSAGAEEANQGSQPRHHRRGDTAECSGCFIAEGRCMTAPATDPEEMRGDEVPVVEPVPCNPRCCETE